MWWVFLGAGLGFGVLTLARAMLLVVRVNGSSMRPAYRDGDRILVLRRPWLRSLRTGQVVVFSNPFVEWAHAVDGSAVAGHGAIPPYLVKRVAATAGKRIPPGQDSVPSGHVYVLGDIPGTFDSSIFGPLPVDKVIGVVIRDMTSRDRSARGNRSPEG